MRTRSILVAGTLVLLLLVAGIYALLRRQPVDGPSAEVTAGEQTRAPCGAKGSRASLQFYLALPLGRALALPLADWKARGLRGLVVPVSADAGAELDARRKRLLSLLTAQGLQLLLDARQKDIQPKHRQAASGWTRVAGVLVRHEQASKALDREGLRLVVDGGPLPELRRARGISLGGPLCFRSAARCWVEGGRARGLHATLAALVSTGARTLIWHVQQPAQPEALVRMLSRASRLQRGGAVRPLLGVVADERLLWQTEFFPLLAEASSLAGYRLALVEATDARPVARAALFAGDDSSAPARIAKLLARDGPLLLAISRLEPSALWQSTLVAAGLDPRFEGAPLARGPLRSSRFDGEQLRWDAGGERAMDTIMLDPADVQGEVVASGEVQGERVALVVRQGRVVLLNGSRLHREARFILQRLLGGALVKPFDGWGMVGKKAAFVATKRSALAANLPLAEGAKIRVTRVDAAGGDSTVEVWSYRAPLRATVEAGELLLVAPLE